MGWCNCIAMEHCRGLYQGFVLAATFFELDKLYCITGAGITVTAEATVGIGSRINLKARRLVRVEGANEPVILIWPQPVMIQHPVNRKPLFNKGYFHLWINFVFVAYQIQKYPIVYYLPTSDTLFYPQ